jgi:hypothetical protein
MTSEGPDEPLSPAGRSSRIDARWMPIVAAGIGLIGGLGGALVGGWLANRGQEKQFESERAAAAQELRREAYADYLGTAEAFVVSYAEPQASTDAEERTLEAERRALVQKLFVSRARVFLVRENIDVEKAAEAITAALFDDELEAAAREACGKDQACLDSLDDKQYNAYVEAGNTFLSRARQEITETAE